jgi:hypothetical protein
MFTYASVYVAAFVYRGSMRIVRIVLEILNVVEIHQLLTYTQGVYE